MNKGDTRDCNSAALLIHSVLFAYQKSHGRMVGSGSRAVLQLAMEFLPLLLKEFKFPELNRGKSVEDNISSYITMVRETGYFEDAVLSQSGENGYTFESKNCKFASTGHKIFTSGHICPFAILAASVLYLKTGENISMSESEFTKTGSRTVINVHKKASDNLSALS